MALSWDDVSFLLASEYRRKIMKALKEGPRTPSMLAKETSLYPEHVSRTLKELKKRKLILCLTPNRKRGKLFKLTEIGKKTLKKMPSYK